MQITINTRAIQLVAVMFLGGSLLSGCGVGEASLADSNSLQAATPIPVEVSEPVRSDIFATYEASASIHSDSDAPAVARVGGDIVELLVEEGQRVEQGQILARLDGQRLRLEMLAAKTNLNRAQREHQRNLDLHERGLVSTSMFEGLKFDVDALQASYELARLNYGYSSIRAPISGVVSAREVKPGQNLTAGTTAFRITDTRELLAHLQIPQAELVKISAGQKAYLEVASVPGSRYEAFIVRVSPTIDVRNGTARATAAIDNTDAALAPGMFGRFTIAYEEHTDALVIPANALIDEDEETAVYVVRNGQVSRRLVRVGIESGGRVEILDGLSIDEKVVVVGHSGLKDGSKVLASTADRDSYTG